MHSEVSCAIAEPTPIGTPQVLCHEYPTGLPAAAPLFSTPKGTAGPGQAPLPLALLINTNIIGVYMSSYEKGSQVLPNTAIKVVIHYDAQAWPWALHAVPHLIITSTS
jgi:hypothetical protein